MGDFGDKRNAEGYHDPTPYQAIKNMIKPGEIWTFQKKDNTEVDVLVVAFSDNVATILFLMDEYKDGCIEIVNSNDWHDVMWVNPRMLNWSWGGYLCKCVRKLDIQEFATVSMEIEKVLSVKIQREAVVTVNHNEVDKLKAELDSLVCRYKEATDIALKYEVRLKEAESDADKYRIQLDMMKTMYSDLMEKFLQRA